MMSISHDIAARQRNRPRQMGNLVFGLGNSLKRAPGFCGFLSGLRALDPSIAWAPTADSSKSSREKSVGSAASAAALNTRCQALPSFSSRSFCHRPPSEALRVIALRACGGRPCACELVDLGASYRRLWSLRRLIDAFDISSLCAMSGYRTYVTGNHAPVFSAADIRERISLVSDAREAESASGRGRTRFMKVPI